MFQLVRFVTACALISGLCGVSAQEPRGAVASRGDTYVLSIGVDLYRDRREFPPLRLAQRDALDVAERFRSVGAICRTLTIGNDPTVKGSELPTSADTVIAAASKMAKDADAEDTLIFYFAGHGLTGSDGVTYLCTHDTDSKNLQGTAVSLSRLFGLFDPDQCRARSVLFLIDACRTREGMRGATARRFNLEGKNALATSGGRCCIQATEDEAEEPPSSETSAGIKNAYFTHVLLLALNSGKESSKNLSLDELVAFIQSEMKKINFARGTKQTPVVFRDSDVNFTVVDWSKAPKPESEVSRRGDDAPLSPNRILITEPRHGAVASSATVRVSGSAVEVPGAILEVNGQSVPVRDGRWSVDAKVDPADGVIAAVMTLGNGESFAHRIRVAVPGANGSEPTPRSLAWAEVPPGTPFVGGLPTHVIHKKTRIEMVLIPAGEFLMGSVIVNGATGFDADAESYEAPRHRVTLTRPFYLSKYEVTEDSMNRNGSKLPKAHVTWPQAVKWCRENDLRLPTEAEWEYAARAGTETIYPWGAEYDLDTQLQYTNCSQDDSALREVGKRLPNRFGLFDMLGNVSEWVADEWSNDYGDPSPKVDPTGIQSGEKSPARIARGCNFKTDPKQCRPARREYKDPQSSEDSLGFRAARNAD